MLNIKKLRKQKGLTLGALSKETTLSSGYISDLENGTKTNPSINTLQKLANALKVSINDLLEAS